MIFHSIPFHWQQEMMEGKQKKENFPFALTKSDERKIYDRKKSFRLFKVYYAK